jgi:hypothetical protein
VRDNNFYHVFVVVFPLLKRNQFQIFYPGSSTIGSIWSKPRCQKHLIIQSNIPIKKVCLTMFFLNKFKGTAVLHIFILMTLSLFALSEKPFKNPRIAFTFLNIEKANKKRCHLQILGL